MGEALCWLRTGCTTLRSCAVRCCMSCSTWCSLRRACAGHYIEEVYHKTDDRKAAWHFFEPVTVELNGKEETFLTNISVVEFIHGSERIFSLELTIEDPISDAEGRAAPASGRPAQHANGVSDVRVAAFQSFVKKEKTNYERKSREKGLIPWRVDEARLNELRGEAAKVQKEIDALLAKFGGDETKLQNYRRDRRKLYELREQLAQKQALIAAEYKPEGIPDVSKPKAPNGKDSNLPLIRKEPRNGQTWKSPQCLNYYQPSCRTSALRLFYVNM